MSGQELTFVRGVTIAWIVTERVGHLEGIVGLKVAAEAFLVRQERDGVCILFSLEGVAEAKVST